MTTDREPRTTGLPAALWDRPVRVLRPRDGGSVYRDAPKEFARLARIGLLERLATGYYALVPPDRVESSPPWRPPLVEAAWGIAAADYGVDAVAVCGPAAARHHGLIPRALAVAHVAVPKQRPALPIDGGEARYVTRRVPALDLERMRMQLGDGWVTSVEQTALDLAARPAGWRLPAAEIEEALRAALPRLDRRLLVALGDAQRRRAAVTRLLAIEN